MSMTPPAGRRQLLRFVPVVGLCVLHKPHLAMAQAARDLSPRERLLELVQDARRPLLSELISQVSQIQVFSSWLAASKLAAQLESMTDITVFAPLDSVWPESLRSTTVDQVTARNLILRHVVPNRWNDDTSPDQTLSALSGETIRVEDSRVNKLGFELSGLRIRNGFVHLIQGML